jgi:hypothetical protein
MRILPMTTVRELWDMYHQLGHMCNLANNTVKLDREGDWFEPVLKIRIPLSLELTPFILFAPSHLLQLSNQAKNILC